MYVFGGVSSYSELFNNDLNLFDTGNAVWSQLQSSFVPKIPSADQVLNKPDGGTIHRALFLW
jgi:hypothetical protein